MGKRRVCAVCESKEDVSEFEFGLPLCVGCANNYMKCETCGSWCLTGLETFFLNRADHHKHCIYCKPPAGLTPEAELDWYESMWSAQERNVGEYQAAYVRYYGAIPKKLRRR